ncbi:hypothetical protein ACLMAL_28735 [Nocardia sp. CWNU-33]|uniref:hypothetical protein n=1 Tax=Nocardia sp. CWNU-33 TaxID=3392117 RepID=UPI00398F4732
MRATGHPSRMAIAALAVAAVTTVFTSGCDEAKKAVNAGGDTPCNEFVAQDNDKQRVTVTKFLEQERSSDKSAPTNDQTIDAAIASIELMCKAQANPDTPIRKADLTGIFVPK